MLSIRVSQHLLVRYTSSFQIRILVLISFIYFFYLVCCIALYFIQYLYFAFKKNFFYNIFAPSFDSNFFFLISSADVRQKLQNSVHYNSWKEIFEKHSYILESLEHILSRINALELKRLALLLFSYDLCKSWKRLFG